MSDEQRTETRCEIGDLYFWLGEKAERVGFTPWRSAMLTLPAKQPVQEVPQ
jgi:hypothetical protein